MRGRGFPAPSAPPRRCRISTPTNARSCSSRSAKPPPPPPAGRPANRASSPNGSTRSTRRGRRIDRRLWGGERTILPLGGGGPCEAWWWGTRGVSCPICVARLRPCPSTTLRVVPPPVPGRTGNYRSKPAISRLAPQHLVQPQTARRGQHGAHQPQHDLGGKTLRHYTADRRGDDAAADQA